MFRDSDSSQNKQIVKYTYVPDDIGFTHTMPTRFTHFSGSKAGARNSFGLSCETLAKLVQKFNNEITNQRNVYGESIVRYVEDINQQIQTFSQQLRDEVIYSSAWDVAQGITSSGHIPIMLSAITAAGNYEVAASAVSSNDVSFYADHVPGSFSQAREFLVKQDMIKLLVSFQEQLKKLRYEAEAKGQSQMVRAYNTVIKKVIEEIIYVNRDSLPRDCEQFDLYNAFKSKIFSIVSEFDNQYFCNRSTRQSLKGEILSGLAADPYGPGHYDYMNVDSETYIEQEKLSSFLYEKLSKYFKDHLGIDADIEEFELSNQQDEMLQDVLPLLAYLNSEHNPFARNGLFGKLIENDFHQEALAAYKLHEKKCKVGLFVPPNNKAQAEKVEFTSEQIEVLLFGVEQAPTQTQSATGLLGFFSTVRGLLTEGSVNDRSNRSDSQQRRELLALPMPAQYQQFLMIEAAPSAFSTPSSSVGPKS